MTPVHPHSTPTAVPDLSGPAKSTPGGACLSLPPQPTNFNPIYPTNSCHCIEPHLSRPVSKLEFWLQLVSLHNSRRRPDEEQRYDEPYGVPDTALVFAPHRPSDQHTADLSSRLAPTIHPSLRLPLAILLHTRASVRLNCITPSYPSTSRNVKAVLLLHPPIAQPWQTRNPARRRGNSPSRLPHVPFPTLAAQPSPPA